MVAKLGIIVDSDAPVAGDFYNPFFRVLFTDSLEGAREFTDQELRVQRREARTSQPGTRNRAPTAHEVPNQSLHRNDPEVNNRRNVRSDGDVIDSRYLSKVSAELEVTQSSEEASMFTLTLMPPYDDAVAILENRIIRRGNYVVVEFGFTSQDRNDILSGPYLFQIQEPAAEFGEQISITLTGNDILSNALPRVERKRTWRRKKREGAQSGSGGFYPTDFRIIEALARSLHMTVDIGDSGRRLIAKDASLFEPKENAREQEASDWEFFKKVLKDNEVGFLIQGNRILLFDRLIHVIKEEPSYRLLYRATPTKDTDVPIINFSAEIRANLFNAPSGRNVTTVGTDRDTGRPKTSVADSANPGNTALVGTNTSAGDLGTGKVTKTQAGTVKDRKIPEGQTGRTISGSGNDEHLAGRGREVASEGRHLEGIMATITTPGLPGLRPQRMVIVDGVPEFYRGIYRVTKVVHKWGGSGAETELTVYRDGPLKETANARQSNAPFTEKSAVGDQRKEPKIEDGR